MSVLTQPGKNFQCQFVCDLWFIIFDGDKIWLLFIIGITYLDQLIFIFNV
jgi:hypothetical protein